MPGEPVSAVEASSVSSQKPFHALHQIGFGRFNHQMKMVSHQAPGVNLPVGLGTGFAEGLHEQLAIFFAAKDVLAMIAPAHDMINGACVLDSELSGHWGQSHEFSNTCQYAEPTPLRPLCTNRRRKKFQIEIGLEPT